MNGALAMLAVALAAVGPPSGAPQGGALGGGASPAPAPVGGAPAGAAATGVAGVSSASGAWISPDRVALPDLPFRKATRGFGAALYLIDDGTFFERWSAPSPGATWGLRTVATIERNRFFYTAIVFANPRARRDGTSAVELDVTVYRPDGKVYSSVPGMTAMKGHKGLDDLKLAGDFLAIRIEDKDPIGTYRVHVVVRDKVGGVWLPLDAQISATAQATPP